MEETRLQKPLCRVLQDETFKIKELYFLFVPFFLVFPSHYYTGRFKFEGRRAHLAYRKN